MSEETVPAQESKEDERNLVRYLFRRPHKVNSPDFSLDLFSENSAEQKIAKAIHRLQGQTDGEVTTHTIAQMTGDSKLALLCEKICTKKPTASWTQSTQILRSKLQRRRAIATLDSLHGKFNTASDSEIEDLVTTLEQQSMKVRASSGSGNGTDIGDTKKLESELEWRAKNPGMIRGIRSGFNDLDRLLNGLRGGQAILIAARPSVGKTAIMLSMMTTQLGSKHFGVPVVPGFYSLEMNVVRIQDRIVAQLSGVNIGLGEQLSETDLNAHLEAMRLMRSFPGKIYDESRNIHNIIASIRRLHAEIGMNIVYIDYIQIISVPEANGDERREISIAMELLKALAVELDIPIVIAAQLRRPVRQLSRDGGTVHTVTKAPELDELKGSGSLEEDADVVAMLSRNVDISEERDVNAVLDVQKHRDGPKGTQLLTYRPQITRYMERKHD